jgi:hypothetical protein
MTRSVKGQPHAERAAFPLDALDADRAAVLLDDALRYTEANSGAVCKRYIPASTKAFKYVRQIGTGDPNAMVGHADYRDVLIVAGCLFDA